MTGRSKAAVPMNSSRRNLCMLVAEACQSSTAGRGEIRDDFDMANVILIWILISIWISIWISNIYDDRDSVYFLAVCSEQEAAA